MRRCAIALPQPRVNPTPQSCGLIISGRVACGCVFSNTKPDDLKSGIALQSSAEQTVAQFPAEGSVILGAHADARQTDASVRRASPGS